MKRRVESLADDDRRGSNRRQGFVILDRPEDLALDAYHAARHDEQHAAANGALKSVGMLTGHWVERRDVDMAATVSGSVRDPSRPR